ncbi:MAG: AMP-binding protein [Dysgonomonas sp.]
MIKENFIELYEKNFRESWDLPALTNYAEKKTFLYKDLATKIAKTHIFFEKAGIKRGDKIALVGRNNINWCVVHLSTMSYGAVIVPILQDFHPDNIHHIVNHSEAKLLYVSDNIWENIEETKIPDVEGIFSLTDLSCLYQKQGKPFDKILNNLDSEMEKRYPSGYSKENVKYNKVDNSEIVLLNYTSGTTGFSKGVMLTANNLAGNVTYAGTLDILHRGENIVSFLPLAHAYGAAFEFLYSLSIGAHTILLGKTPSPKILMQAFADYKPSLIISVPLIIEKIYKKMILPKIERPAMKVALKVPVLREKIYAKIRKKLVDAFGGNFCQIIIGGAALNPDVEDFLYKIKFPFTVGYGMTECAPLISYDRFSDFVPTSCGQILKNIMRVRVDSVDPYNVIGEIQVQGENVMAGYYKNEDATKTAFTQDGWLKTGDLGTIDRNNRIFIRGRSKSMILGPNGQNIFPEEIEARLNNMPYIMESIVVNREGKLVALVYPDYEAMDNGNVTQDDLPDIMKENLADLNKMVSSYENVSSIIMYPNEFEKTPKKSIKRYLYS